MRKKEREILKKALRKFEDLTGFTVETKLDAKLPKKRTVGTKVWIPKIKATLYAEIKLNVTNQTLGGTVHNIKEMINEGQELLITRYITPQMAERLKELNMQFMDTAGNLYINLPKMFLFVKGNKTKEDIIKEKPIRAFQPAGLQLIFTLLCNPGLENQPYRLMADKANIANGAVTWAMKDLNKLGYLIDMGKKGRKLLKKKELLNRWINLYAELLKPKMLIGRYNTENVDWWKQGNPPIGDALMGGETAAAVLTKYLKPQNHTIYTEEKYGKLVLQLKLKTARVGNMELVKKFWNFEDPFDKRNLVNPVLIYADLIATGDPRNLETANILYDTEVIRYIGND
jgi:hypothetical protein